MDKLSIADVLERAADLIEPEGAWTQGVFCRDAEGQDGEFTDYTVGAPVCWCSDGALKHVARDFDTWVEAGCFLRGLLDEPVWGWNDAPERTQAEVVAKLREAAKLAREQPNV